MPVSAIQAAKRALVSLFLTLARYYQVTLTLCRDSADKDVVTAFRKVVLKAHPDKGGRDGDAQKLNDARDVWDTAKKNSAPPPQHSHRQDSADGLNISSPSQPFANLGFRIH